MGVLVFSLGTVIEAIAELIEGDTFEVRGPDGVIGSGAVVVSFTARCNGTLEL